MESHSLLHTMSVPLSKNHIICAELTCCWCYLSWLPTFWPVATKEQSRSSSSSLHMTTELVAHLVSNKFLMTIFYCRNPFPIYFQRSDNCNISFVYVHNIVYKAYDIKYIYYATRVRIPLRSIYQE